MTAVSLNLRNGGVSCRIQHPKKHTRLFLLSKCYQFTKRNPDPPGLQSGSGIMSITPTHECRHHFTQCLPGSVVGDYVNDGGNAEQGVLRSGIYCGRNWADQVKSVYNAFNDQLSTTNCHEDRSV